jgi:hypothetical protein
MNKHALSGAAAVILLLHFASPTPLAAQSCNDFFPLREGTVLKYVNYDKKGKVTGANEMSLTGKKDTPEGIIASFSTKLFDDKGGLIYSGNLDAECRNGTLVFDASKLLDPATMSAYESMEVEVTGDNFQIPVNAGPGTTLEDAGVSAVISSGGMKIMTLTVNVTNRRIEGHETLTTPAGSFECTRYAFDSSTKAGFVRVDLSGIEWYNKDYGTLRSESYDNKGNLTGYSVLESVTD